MTPPSATLGTDIGALAARFRLPIADLASASPRAVEVVPERWARRFHVVPLSLSDRQLVVATADPFDADCERTLEFATGREVVLHLAPAGAIARRIEELYGGDVERETAPPLEIQLLGNEAEAGGTTVAAGDDGGRSVTSLVDELLAQGVAARASDIHIEPEEQRIAVRHRIDGVLRLVRHLPRAVAPALVSRVKIIASLNIADRLRPQDGRARVAVSGVAIDLRISTLPASHGEKIVIRVLDARAAVQTLGGMGFHVEELDRIDRLLEAREGLILVTGPTGSGKTTTLYAALRKLKQTGVNIVTVEDPIEYRLPGIVQVQVNEKAGLTFAAALRSIMRQDPDVILVGEIRDRETAEIAIQASLTGHLVLSTLHTNDAASAVTRLIDIGVAPYKIATALKGVLAQRLIRRSCSACQRAFTPAEGPQPVLRVAEASPPCLTCGGTGFRGRLAVAEILLVSAAVERSIAAGETADRIAIAANVEGMRSLWQSGLAHVRAGATTVEEVRRVASPDQGRDVRASLEPMANLSIGTVDVYVIRPRTDGWRVLVLQRASDTRCPTAWETVHGHLEPGEEPEAAAVREVREETGLAVERLYNVTVQPFYLHTTHQVMLAVVFAAFVAEADDVTLGAEHQRAEWLGVDEAMGRFQWPRERAALAEIVQLLGSGDAGPVEDVLRVF